MTKTGSSLLIVSCASGANFAICDFLSLLFGGSIQHVACGSRDGLPVMRADTQWRHDATSRRTTDGRECRQTDGVGPTSNAGTAA